MSNDTLDLPVEKNTLLKKDGSSSPSKVKHVKDLTPVIPPAAENVKLTFPDGKTVELPILKGTAGPPMIDI